MEGRKRKLTAKQITQLRQEYEALDFYDPDAEDTVAKLLERWDISKPTLYRYRDVWMQEDADKMVQSHSSDLRNSVATLVSMLAEERHRRNRLEGDNERVRSLLAGERERTAELQETIGELRATLRHLDS